MDYTSIKNFQNSGRTYFPTKTFKKLLNALEKLSKKQNLITFLIL